MNAKFDFYDLVKISTSNPKYAALKNKLLVIRGKAQNEKTGEWIYGVNLYEEKDLGMIRRVYEKDLLSTGKKANRLDFTSNEKIKVSVNPKTGESDII